MLGPLFGICSGHSSGYVRTTFLDMLDILVFPQMEEVKVSQQDEAPPLFLFTTPFGLL
jgi:hypothetical protein